MIKQDNDFLNLPDDVLNTIINNSGDSVIQSIFCANLAQVSKKCYKIVSERQYEKTLIEKLTDCRNYHDIDGFFEKYWTTIKNYYSYNHIFYCLEKYFSTRYYHLLYERYAHYHNNCTDLHIFCEFLFCMCVSLTKNLKQDHDKSHFLALIMTYINYKDDPKYSISQDLFQLFSPERDAFYLKTVENSYWIQKEMGDDIEYYDLDFTCGIWYSCEVKHINYDEDCIWCRGYECEMCKDSRKFEGSWCHNC